MEPSFILDATILLPHSKHKILFEKFDSLKVGGSFIVKNDHHTKSFYHLLKSHRGDRFEWKYLQSGPVVWKVIIQKTM
ncbi:DUF2249 domain-containing protein [Rhodocytophaga aerolata]|uniref:DUF2249 domain-containing protein n=1 Tax=Rhodocytophaga aerolata TaxID=455078 RepID=A0ABT8RGM5_9BACT|nr:DUF2249 domain-containing protein [Rhodocytophaga aerolata]MDO1450851.1 DUF2249 domain-containing protein [Rhodocytophaga aerolata]